MTSTPSLENFLQTSKDMVDDAFYNDAWRSTSYLINLLNKIELYCESLGEQDPSEEGFYKSEVAIAAAGALFQTTYSCPVDDERFEEVNKMCDDTYITFIRDHSDDAAMDLIYLGCLANYVAGMRVHAFSNWIEQTAPDETKFQSLKLAKRDAEAVQIAVHILGETVKNTLGMK